jgi:hypothetical protein
MSIAQKEHEQETALQSKVRWICNGCTSDVRHELNMSHMLSTRAPTTGLHEALLSIHCSTNMSEWADTETIHGKY